MKENNKDLCILVREMKHNYQNHFLSKESDDVIKNHLEKCEECQNIFLEKKNEDIEENNRFNKISKKLRMKKTRNRVVIGTIIAFLIIIVLYLTSIDNITQIGGMEPEIGTEESVYIFKFAYTFSEPERQDMVAYKYDNIIDVSRIVAKPGELVEIKNNNLYVNGELIERYEGIKADENSKYIKNDIYSVRVPKDGYFIIGDNLENSYDSRYDDFGFVSKDNICGKVILHTSNADSFLMKTTDIQMKEEVEGKNE